MKSYKFSKGVVALALGILLSSTYVNASSKHNMNIGIDTMSGDTSADFGLNIGYSYIMGNNWLYGVGTNLIIANGNNETGDTYSVDLKVGKKLNSQVSIYGFLGVAAMNTGYKDIHNDEIIAHGAMFGVSLDYKVLKDYSLQLGYKKYDLDYDINMKQKDYDVDSVMLNIVYRF